MNSSGNDLFIVISVAGNGRRWVRYVVAGDEDQARHAHLELHPLERLEEIVRVRDGVIGVDYQRIGGFRERVADGGAVVPGPDEVRATSHVGGLLAY